MAISMSRDKEKTYLTIDGELTIYKAQEYTEYLVDNFTGENDLDIKLEGIDEIDTCGLQIIAAIGKQLSNNGKSLKIIATSNAVKEALETSQMMTDMMFISGSVAHES